MLLYAPPWNRQPTEERIRWAHPRAEGLAFFAPLSGRGPAVDLVRGRHAIQTGLTGRAPTTAFSAVYRLFGSSQFADWPDTPPEIGPTTPFTVAWTQEPRATSGAGTTLNINFGTAGVDLRFLVYQSASADGYQFTAGPQSSTGAHSWSTAVGVLTNDRLDRFVLRCAGGSQSTTGSDFTLYRNGVLITRGTTTSFTGSTTAAFRVGALIGGGDPFEGLMGDLRMWARVLSDAEAERESRVEETWELYEPQRIWVPVAAGGGVAGVLSATLADATSVATGAVLIAGVAAPTLASLTSAATGALAIAGSASPTLAAATLAAAGSVAIAGASAPTLAAATLAATGQLAVAGAVSATLDAATLAATGTLGSVVTGELTQTLGAATLSASGAVLVSGVASPTLADASLAATGEVDIAAALGVALGDLVVTGLGALSIAGAATQTLGALTLAASGTGSDSITGELTATLEDLGLDATMGLRVLAALSAQRSARAGVASRAPQLSSGRRRN